MIAGESTQFVIQQVQAGDGYYNAGIAQYLSSFYPKAAPRVLREIREEIERLTAMPNMCEEYEYDRFAFGQGGHFFSANQN